MTAAIPRKSWALLRAQWLDVPIGADIGCRGLTWGAFSEVFEGCLEVVASYVSQRVSDPAAVEVVVTGVVVGNLHILASSRLGDGEKLERLLVAADHLIALSAATHA